MNPAGKVQATGTRHLRFAAVGVGVNASDRAGGAVVDLLNQNQHILVIKLAYRMLMVLRASGLAADLGTSLTLSLSAGTK